VGSLFALAEFNKQTIFQICNTNKWKRKKTDIKFIVYWTCTKLRPQDENNKSVNTKRKRNNPKSHKKENAANTKVLRNEWRLAEFQNKQNDNKNQLKFLSKWTCKRTEIVVSVFLFYIFFNFSCIPKDMHYFQRLKNQVKTCWLKSLVFQILLWFQSIKTFKCQEFICLWFSN